MDKLLLRSFNERNIPNITVTKHRLDIIAENLDEIEFAKNESLLKQGKASSYFYLPGFNSLTLSNQIRLETFSFSVASGISCSQGFLFIFSK